MSCCGGSKMSPDLAEKNTTETVVLGVGPVEKARFVDGAEVAATAAAAENGCKCGSNCTCDPCNCK